jgi:hypothetical protein
VVVPATDSVWARRRFRVAEAKSHVESVTRKADRDPPYAGYHRNRGLSPIGVPYWRLPDVVRRALAILIHGNSRSAMLANLPYAHDLPFATY